MKIENLVYAAVQRVFHELEHTHHYVVPDNIKQQVLESVTQDVDALID